MSTAGACRQQDAVSELGRHRVRTALDTGEVCSPWPGVLVDPRRAADPLTIVAAAWLVVGPDAVIASSTAAFLHGCDAVAPTPVHLMVPYESHKRRRAGIVVHNGLALAADQVVLHGMPVFGVERVVTDVACTLDPPDALAVLDQVLARHDGQGVREAFRARIHDRLRARPDPRGTRVGGRLVDLATGRAESPAESWLLWRIVDLGFPVPEVNHWVRTIEDLPLHRLDLSWPGLRIALEYDGYAAHAERTEQDSARILDLERRGWIVVVATSDDLRGSSRMERELLAAFLKRGMDVRKRTPGVLRPDPHRGLKAG